MIKVASVPLEQDISILSRWLDAKGVSHRISEEQGRQVIFMPNERLGLQFDEILQRFTAEPDFREELLQQLQHAQPRRALVTLYPRVKPQQAPIIFSFIGLSIVIAYLTNLGEGGPVLRALLILDPFQLDGELLTLSERVGGLFETLQQGAWWRLVSPDLIHFNLMHITFNLLMLWILGGQLELQRGSMAFLNMALFVSIISNVAQLLDGGYLFGGLSGVVYGLVGYCWVWQRRVPEIFLPPALMRFSLVWLLLGYTPVTEWLGLGRMANSAHLYGLLAGLLWGWLTTALGSKKIPNAH